MLSILALISPYIAIALLIYFGIVFSFSHLKGGPIGRLNRLMESLDEDAAKVLAAEKVLTELNNTSSHLSERLARVRKTNRELLEGLEKPDGLGRADAEQAYALNDEINELGNQLEDKLREVRELQELVQSLKTQHRDLTSRIISERERLFKHPLIRLWWFLGNATLREWQGKEDLGEAHQ